jgi:hypothetical protein
MYIGEDVQLIYLLMIELSVVLYTTIGYVLKGSYLCDSIHASTVIVVITVDDHLDQHHLHDDQC